MNQQLSISFTLRTSRRSKTGLFPIQVRVALNQEIQRFATGLHITAQSWDSASQRAYNISAKEEMINVSLDAIHNRLTKSYFKVMNLDYFDLGGLMAEYTGESKEKERTLLELVTKHNDDFKRRIGIDRTQSTYQKYTITEMRIKSFIRDYYNGKDILLKRLKINFIKDFSIYLTEVFENKQNTVAKNVKNLKHIITHGLELEWLVKNPFFGFRYAYVETQQAILTQEEINSIETKMFSSQRVERVKNLFLFQCYTGLSYVDMAKLISSNIVKGNDGNDWLVFSRTKSKIPVRIPLLSKAKSIIELYKNAKGDFLMPVYANQNMNILLKDIADLCGIKKNLTTHVGRRTFATTVLLSNGIPIETVSKLLGHTNLRATQVYAKVVDNKISKEMMGLEDLLRKKSQKECD